MDEGARERIRYYSFAAFVGVLLLLNWLGVFTSLFGLDTAILVTLLAGYKTFHNSISALLEKRISADIALCVAVIAALAVGQYLAAAEAMFIVLVGEGLESYAAGRTAAAIHRFVEQIPRRARVLRGGIEEEVEADSLAAGDLILVRAGERVPADGVILDGFSLLDESSITGEPLPREKQPGDEVFTGSLNSAGHEVPDEPVIGQPGSGLLRVRVVRAGSETTLARVARLVEEAEQRRAPVERLADRAARYFLPALLLAAALTFFFTRDWMRTVAVLIVACPCALILATPTAMVAAIGGLARRGILVRGAAVLQQAAKVDAVVFDKTGTITEGRFEIVEILPQPANTGPAGGPEIAVLDRSEDDLLAFAAAAEAASHHPLARLIIEEARRRSLPIPPAENARAVPGRGVECEISGRTVRAGNAAFIAAPDSLVEHADRLGATPVFLSVDGSPAGAIFLRDRLRQGAHEASAALHALGISDRRLLTGDRRPAAEAVARQAAIPHCEAELLPEQKVERIHQLAAQGRTVAMVGDGINDAPALASAAIGIAVAGAADITAEAAGVVYLPHSLETLPLFFETSRRAVATAWQNIILFAGALNLAAVLCAATGVINPVGAAVTHQLSSFLVMMNSLRLLRTKRLPVAKAIASFRLRAASWLRRARNVNPRFAAAAVVATLLLNGFYVVSPDEIGIIQRFGRKIVPFSQPGLHYKLSWPVEKLTRIRAHQVRVVEIGFRSVPGSPDAEPPTYEWNAQHRTGRFQRRPEESLLLTGDQNLIELNATVHYDLPRPADYLFTQADGDASVRAAAESALETIITTAPLDNVLTTGREAIEQRLCTDLQSRLDHLGTGARVLAFRLQDVHPSVEVVDAFREVSAAFEEKNRLINEAEGYRNEQIALARGNGQARIEQARAYALGRVDRAQGDAARFDQRELAYRTAPGPTETRLYLETIEQVLAGKKKLIVDRAKLPRHLFLWEDGVEIAGPNAPILKAPGEP
ncbi:MAG TPA: FtsH protease activity modulator HflK [Bryobacteraceae bacterium]|nr:FtsH protease activity modulator HflK [Bryobacteraceae bacterium]